MLMELVCGIELQNYGQGHILCSGCEYRTVSYIQPRNLPSFIAPWVGFCGVSWCMGQDFSIPFSTAEQLRKL